MNIAECCNDGDGCLDDDNGSPGQSPPPSSPGWHVFDNAMTKRPATSNGGGDTKEDDDEGDASLFSEFLYRELESSQILQNLQPARTQGDRRVDEIIALLTTAGMPLGGGQSPTEEAEDDDGKSDVRTHEGGADSVGITRDTIRGDRSLFVSREYRRDHEAHFAVKHPYLHCLVETVSGRIRDAFCVSAAKDGDECGDNYEPKELDIDLSLTSVQVAVYPGDGESGYIRHCDRGQDFCQDLQQQQQQQHETQSNISREGGEPQRIITAIYYLTPNDWSATLDDGALRIFHTKNDHPEEDEYSDIIPYSNRMVVFRSDVVEHQVMPSLRRPRTAVTMWFYGHVKSGAKAFRSAEPGHFHEASLNTTGSTSSEPLKSQSPVPLPSPLPTVVQDMKDDARQRQPELPTIFVSIASYRDSETRPTLDSLFENALYPHRISVGIVLQLLKTTARQEGGGDFTVGSGYDEQIWQSVIDADRVSPSNSRPWKAHQVRCIRMDARDAMGPCYARGLCQTLYRREDYAMQIDSHMRFRKNWDEYLIQTWQACCRQRERDGVLLSERVLLTTYPVGYTLPNNIPSETRGTYLVPWKFDSHGILRQRGRLLAVLGATTKRSTDPATIDSHYAAGTYPNLKSYRHYLYAGGFNFGQARAVMNDVPYDTMGLQHLFFGEELSMAVRFYTHGYDLYAPEQTVCYHLWSRQHRPTTVTDSRRLSRDSKQQDAIAEASRAKVQQQLMGERGMIGIPFGLGNHRPASGFAEHLGVNFADRTFVGQVGSWENGDLSPGDFAARNHESLLDFEPGSVEARVASLDSNAQRLIGSFLQGIRLID
jgi:hypothetical protein